MAENGRKFWKYPRCFVLVGFARGQHLGENEFRLNVANYECEFLPEYLGGLNIADYRQGRGSQVSTVGRWRSEK